MKISPWLHLELFLVWSILISVGRGSTEHKTVWFWIHNFLRLLCTPGWKTKHLQSWFMKVIKWLLLLKYVLTAMNSLGDLRLFWDKLSQVLYPPYIFLSFQMLPHSFHYLIWIQIFFPALLVFISSGLSGDESFRGGRVSVEFSSSLCSGLPVASWSMYFLID